MKRLLLLIFLLAAPCVSLFSQQLVLAAQQQGLDALKADYPKLMEKFGKELETQRADYIFAIDVSGTMSRWKPVVVPALGAFFNSLQEGDYVSIIKFGAEATNDVGSAGKIDAATLINLKDCAEHIYDTPQTEAERKRFFNWTDLDNMLHYLATDMKQIDRNRLKFVFLITDFLHDPSAERRGKEDWDGVARRFATEQSGNDVYVFALQLPGTGSGRDLERVRSVFPDAFHFNHVRVDNGNALSDWFTQRKNAILLNKFQALIAHKIQPPELVVDPALDIDGNVELAVSWKPNPVYDVLRLDEADTSVPGFEFRTRLPATVDASDGMIEAGKLHSLHTDLLHPAFKRVRGEIQVEASFDVPYHSELAALGFAEPRLDASGPVERTIFCYPLPLWLFCLIILLIILYIILVIRAFLRNRSDFYKINGTFEVTSGGLPVADRKRALGLNEADFGDGARFLQVPGCRWALRIFVQRYNVLLLFFRSPKYKVQMTKGSSFKTVQKWGVHQVPTIGRFTTITVGDYRIRWIQPK